MTHNPIDEEPPPLIPCGCLLEALLVASLFWAVVLVVVV